MMYVNPTLKLPYYIKQPENWTPPIESLTLCMSRGWPTSLNEEKTCWEWITWSLKGNRFDLLSNSFDIVFKHCMWIWRLNPLSSNIYIQILQTDLHTFPWRISWENLIEDQSIFPEVIIVWRNWCWSLLELKVLKSQVSTTSKSTKPRSRTFSFPRLRMSTYVGLLNNFKKMVNFPNPLEEKMTFLLIGLSPTDETTPHFE